MEYDRRLNENPDHIDLDAIDIANPSEVAKLVRAFRESSSLSRSMLNPDQPMCFEIGRLRMWACDLGESDPEESRRLLLRADLFDELKSRHNTHTLKDVWSVLEQRAFDVNQVAHWIDLGLLATPDLMHAVKVGYPELDSAATAKFQLIYGRRIKDIARILSDRAAE